MLNLLFVLMLGCVKDSVVEAPEVQYVEIEACANILGYQVCDFDAIDEVNDIVSLYELDGHPIVLDLSAMWCGPCKSAAEDVQDTQDAYYEHGLVYLTLLIDDNQGAPPTADDLTFWKESFGIEDAPVWGGDRSLITPDAVGTAEGLFLSGWPTFYFFDSDMKMKGYVRGYSEESIEQGISYIIP